MSPVVVGSSPIGHPKSPRKWRPPKIDCAGTQGAACRVLVDAALAQIAANVSGAIEARDPEYLHQLRVGIRRLRTVLRIFKLRELERRVRKLTRPLGEARDLDVLVVRFGRGRELQRKAHQRCRQVLESAEFRALFLAMDEVHRDVAEAPLLELATRAVDRMHRKALKRARGIDWRDEDRRHAVRIAVRRARYACDFFSPCFHDPRRYLRCLEDLQDLLGELNDIAVARRFGVDQPEDALIRRLVSAWRAFGKETPPAAAR